MSRATATALLVLTTMIWGSAFIAQKTAMDVLDPLTFMAARYLLGGLVLLPLAYWENKRTTAPLPARGFQLTGLVIVAMIFGSWLQQQGLLTASVTNAGFLTGFYVFFVPALAAIFYKAKPNGTIWVAAAFALAGLFFLSGGRVEYFVVGDYLVLASSLFWAMYIFCVGTAAHITGRPITMSAAVYIVSGLVFLVCAFLFETPDLIALQTGWVEILYTGALSTAVGFTLQTISQQHMPTVNAALILSMESLFAALGAALILGERLEAAGYLGAALIFTAILLAEAGPGLLGRVRRKPKAV